MRWIPAALLACLLALPAAAEEVDMALVLLADVSFSIDDHEYTLQKRGYAEAFASSRVIDAVRSGPLGRVAVIYVEWDGSAEVMVPWTIIRSAEDSRAFADAIAHVTRHDGNGMTAVASAILFGHSLFPAEGIEPVRRVLDVSGDGIDNQQGDTTSARDLAVADGMTVNGLPIGGEKKVVAFYHDQVIGGPRAFLARADDFEAFGVSVIDKIAVEISGAPPPDRLAGR
ncbi:MAG: DUF1194 domain-containing protein [Actinomycetota bacterium]